MQVQNPRARILEEEVDRLLVLDAREQEGVRLRSLRLHDPTPVAVGCHPPVQQPEGFV